MAKEYITKDSGEHQSFSTGAKRDIQSGKSRPDLIPPLVAKLLIEEFSPYYGERSDWGDMEDAEEIGSALLLKAYAWQEKYHVTPAVILGVAHLMLMLNEGGSLAVILDRYGGLLGRGAEKYGDRNWEKGMPLSRFYASGMRHLVQALDRQEDEDHLAAALFNFGAIYHFERQAGQSGVSEDEKFIFDAGPFAV